MKSITAAIKSVEEITEVLKDNLVTTDEDLRKLAVLFGKWDEVLASFGHLVGHVQNDIEEDEIFLDEPDEWDEADDLEW